MTRKKTLPSIEEFTKIDPEYIFPYEPKSLEETWPEMFKKEENVTKLQKGDREG